MDWRHLSFLLRSELLPLRLFLSFKNCLPLCDFGHLVVIFLLNRKDLLFKHILGCHLCLLLLVSPHRHRNLVPIFLDQIGLEHLHLLFLTFLDLTQDLVKLWHALSWQFRISLRHQIALRIIVVDFLWLAGRGIFVLVILRRKVLPVRRGLVVVRTDLINGLVCHKIALDGTLPALLTPKLGQSIHRTFYFVKACLAGPHLGLHRERAFLIAVEKGALNWQCISGN